MNQTPNSSGLATRFPTRLHRLTLPGLIPAGLPATIDLLAPADPDALLDDPLVEQRYKADNYLPYWPIIWPSGLMLAHRILTASTSPPSFFNSNLNLTLTLNPNPDPNPNPNLPPNPHPLPASPPRCIDLGCGLGTTGIAAALRGWHVTFTDYDPEAIQFAAHNAQRNGIPPERIRALHMDWRCPLPETFPWVLASDVLYERRLHPLVLSAIQKLLAPQGAAWVSDPQRTSAENFPLAAVERGFKVATINLEGESFSGGKQAGQLYILTRP